MNHLQLFILLGGIQRDSFQKVDFFILPLLLRINYYQIIIPNKIFKQGFICLDLIIRVIDYM